MRALIVTASACGLLLTAAGAAGAHLIAHEAGEAAGWVFPVNQWNSALLYGFVHTLAGVAAALSPAGGRLRLAAGWVFIAGVVMFSGLQIATLFWAGLAPAGASLDRPATPLDMLSPLVPAGGISMMAGWVLMGAAAVIARKPRAP